MGTSTSSSGPGSGVPIVPPWVPPLPPLPPTDSPDSQQPPENQEAQLPQKSPADGADVSPVKLAPRARFRDARKALGRFAATGSSGDLKKALGHYVRSGLGGARMATRRMGGTLRTVGALYGATTAGMNGWLRIGIDPTAMAGRSFGEISDRIIDAIRPVDGTLDAEATRESLKEGLSNLLDAYPTADLLGLTAEQIDFLLIDFLSNEICNRVELDIGKSLFGKAPGAEAMQRWNDLREYVHTKVSSLFSQLREQGPRITQDNVAGITRQVIQATFQVFEEDTQ